ncbi:heme-binding protein [Pseudarthrobacter sp. SSS035]|uniref:GlcG/HbpS family heme-binding protein n=1 Tax=Pseudarthrobacter sp. SSS035 TaxID=2931399 RepID=UPI00200F08D2|nr:heme-binding protein [Pseudarthrobacter sp. SSS035]
MTPSDEPIQEMHRTLTLDGAHAVLERAEQHAKNLQISVCIAVVDRSGWLLSFARTGDAPLISIQLSQDKAFSVAAFGGKPTHEWAEVLEGNPVLAVGLTKTERLSVIGGGIPILRGRQMIGAIGVSGGTVEQDRSVAEAGARTDNSSESAIASSVPPVPRRARTAS